MNQYFADITSDGTYTISFSDYNEAMAFFVACYNAEGKCVESTGTASFSVSVLPGQWHSISSEGDAIINLEKSGPIATYSPPVFLGGAIKAKVTVLGMTVGHTVRSVAWCK